MKLNNIKALLTYILILLAVGISANGSSLDSVISKYSEAKMLIFDVRIIVFSDIFEDTDTTEGNIVIADDGRYAADIGDDLYVFDGRCIWEYSSENNQATRNCLKPGEMFENELFFIKNLEKYYKTVSEEKDTLFLMVRKDSLHSQLPDSLYLTLNNSRLTTLKYYDLNHDKNLVHILSDSIFEAVIPSAFDINLPDTVEVITLP